MQFGAMRRPPTFALREVASAADAGTGAAADLIAEPVTDPQQQW